MSFLGKVILITGASSGIGADAALHLAKLGANLSIVGRNKERLNEVAEHIKNSGTSAPLSIIADVTIDSQRIVDETVKHFGKLDVLINSAGTIFGNDNVSSINLNELDEMFKTNVRSVIDMTQLCVPHLEKTNGNIVNISSTCGEQAIDHIIGYAVSKAALNHFTKCAALDLVKKKIRMNSIVSSAVRTPMFEKIGLTPQQTEYYFSERVAKRYPMGRGANLSETSAAIAFLADDKQASYLTGVLLPVDGGALAGGVA